MIPLFLIMAVGIWAYHNSFSVPFVFDDHESIVQNPNIRRLWPLWGAMRAPMGSGVVGRPVLNLSLAVNYALGNQRVWGYHAVNLGIHLLAALLLFGIVRRTLLTDGLRGRYGKTATWLALAVALIWMVHPLQTESVTYLIQRSESLMGLCYLLTLYNVIRSVASPRTVWWSAAAVIACALGMGSKPVMVTAPLAVLLYDRTFLTGSFRRAWRERRALYLGLAATWVLLACFLAIDPPNGHPSAGFSLAKVPPAAYAFTQADVVLHYLRLAVWPAPLCLDYSWPLAASAREMLLPATVLGAALVATGWAMRRYPGLGFLGAWAFLILVPSSSVIPIADAAAEHRMYLPLAGAVALFVLGADTLLRDLASSRLRAMSGLVLSALVVTGLGSMTIRRNADYHSELVLWRDTVAKRPRNARAHSNLCAILSEQGDEQEAISHCTEAIRLDPAYADAHHNLGAVYARQGRLAEAIVHDAEALRLDPTHVQTHLDLGLAFLAQHHLDAALAHFNEALRLAPQSADAYQDLGLVFEQQGDLDAAIAHYRNALRLAPDFAIAHHNLGMALAEQGRLEEAIAHYRDALRLDPDSAETYYNLGLALAQQGKTEEAKESYAKALQLQPDFMQARTQ